MDDTSNVKKDRPSKPLTLVGVNGNVFSVIAFVRQALRDAGFSKEERDEWSHIVNTAESYDEVLNLAMINIDKINTKWGFDGSEEDVSENMNEDQEEEDAI